MRFLLKKGSFTRMLTRRHIRIKVLQAFYAFSQSNSHDLENGLKEFDKIFDISSLLIANKVSYKIKNEEINSFIDRVKTYDK